MNKTQPVIDDTFIVHKTLGVGFTSKVVLAEHRDTGYKLAVKIFKPIKHYKIVLESFRKEVDSMKNLRHENLINIIAANESGIYIDGKEKESIMYLGVELAENAELFDFIADPGREFSEVFARQFFKQLIEGLHAMHKLQVAHRDLKTENLFLDKDFILKIGDFGFSKFMNPEQNQGKLKTQLGTSGYQSPELLEGQLYDGAANDIFALGVILFILTKAYPPFREARKTDSWYRHIYFEKFENFWAAHGKRGVNLSPELIELITGMLRYKNRYTLEDIANSAWMKGTYPSEDTFKTEMQARKQMVDARREKEAQEALLIQNHQQGGKIYRGENEEVIIERLTNQLNDYGVDKFSIKEWDNHSSRYLLRFLNTDAKEIFLNFINILVNEKAEISLSENDFNLQAEMPFEYENEEKSEEESQSSCTFTAQLYIDYNTASCVIELVKDNNTDAFLFKNLVEHLTEKYMK